jgi:hypothetical protein
VELAAGIVYMVDTSRPECASSKQTRRERLAPSFTLVYRCSCM